MFNEYLDKMDKNEQAGLCTRRRMDRKLLNDDESRNKKEDAVSRNNTKDLSCA